MDLIPNIRVASTPAIDADPRIDPRVMWPLEYLRINHGFTLSDSDQHHLHGDVLCAELQRGDLRVTVTWVPATNQRFLTQGRGSQLLGTYDSFRALTSALETLAADSEPGARAA